MSWPCTLTAEDKAAIDANVAALPALSDEALDEIALILAAFRDDRRRRAAARPSRKTVARPSVDD